MSPLFWSEDSSGNFAPAFDGHGAYGAASSEGLQANRAQVAVCRTRDRGFSIGQDVRLPPAAVDLIEREWFYSFDDSAYCRGSKRNEIWITSHEADVPPVLHDGNDIAREQRAFVPAAAGRRRPMQHCAAFEMTTTIDECEIVPKREGCSFPELNAGSFAHDPFVIGRMQKYLRVESLGPLNHRRVKMRMRNGDRSDAAARIHFGDGFVVQQ